MMNEAFNSQLSLYECQQELFYGEDEIKDIADSPTFSSSNPNEVNMLTMESQNQTSHVLEETPIQALIKRCKGHTYEEAQLHIWQIEHKQRLK
ncbi:hypothetical protein O181_048128 [Austropuccinia psidii MF-1]|uniref:Uncharacterized protein n=1 Tax=Austropuccinia psidii MF-1 TaxID=1389203 RepID=A0A9Q3DV81_9BASI|nr:hypothetical protein [Austropuccinia psidii MF-1]